MVVVGESLLRGTEAEVCRDNRMSWEVCCFPGTTIHNVTEVAEFDKPTEHNSFLLIHVGTSDTARPSL